MLLSQSRPRRKLSKGYRLGAYDYGSQPYFKKEVLARIRSTEGGDPG